MLPCNNCGEPMRPNQDIIYWCDKPYVPYAEFTHVHCGPAWLNYIQLRGYPAPLLTQHPTFYTSKEFLAAQKKARRVLHQTLNEYEHKLIVQGRHPNDQEKTSTEKTEEERCT